jgi:hypothetical protein
MIYPLPTPQPLEDAFLLHLDAFHGITEYPLGTLIPAGNRAIKILADDCIVRRGHNSCQRFGIQSQLVFLFYRFFQYATLLQRAPTKE